MDHLGTEGEEGPDPKRVFPARRFDHFGWPLDILALLAYVKLDRLGFWFWAPGYRSLVVDLLLLFSLALVSRAFVRMQLRAEVGPIEATSAPRRFFRRRKALL